jgi:regulator of PEP synthase PpsR (kinase-PPPase family)
MEPTYGIVTQTGAQAMKPSPIYVVSGGTGASGEQLVRTVLVQFPEAQVPVIIVNHVRQVSQIRNTVAEASARQGTIVHTLVDPDLRQALIEQACTQSVVEIDLMGALLSRLSEVLEEDPIVHPGLYRSLHQAYFDRVAAIEFSMAHDDGQRPNGWPEADIVLVGPSRVGKTPMGMYLAVLGWKTANVPLIPDRGVPSGLSDLDRQRVIGLTMEAGQLLFYRRQRQQRLGTGPLGAYTDPAKIHEEMETARAIYRRLGISVLDVTDRPIEASADEIVERVTRRLGSKAHQSSNPGQTLPRR